MENEIFENEISVEMPVDLVHQEDAFARQVTEDETQVETIPNETAEDVVEVESVENDFEKTANIEQNLQNPDENSQKK